MTLRFIGIVLPRVLTRQAYRDDDTRIDGFRFAEDAGSHDEVLWGNAAYAFAGVVIRAFDESGWFTHIRGGVLGIENGGLVEDLDIPWFETDAENVATIFPVETIIRDLDESTLSELGFIPMVRANGTSLGVFCGNASVQRPRTYDRLVASVNARLSSMLQYILCVSRFAHYLKYYRARYRGLGQIAERDRNQAAELDYQLRQRRRVCLARYAGAVSVAGSPDRG